MAQEPRTVQERALELLRATLATCSWLPTTTNMTKFERLVWVIRGAIILGIVVLIVSAVDKTLWDYLELLIVPAALALGVYWLNRRQDERQQQAEDNRSERESAAQAEQVARALRVENERAQDATLQAYLDQMSQLLLDKQRLLRQSEEGDDARILVRARTLAVLERLNADRKKSVVLFLYEADLIQKERSIVSLRDANLNEVKLRASVWARTEHIPRISLQGANLQGANLAGADMAFAVLADADLSQTDLTEAYMPSVHLERSNLSQANMSDANLQGAWLVDATLAQVNLRGANLNSADLTRAIVHKKQLKRAASLQGTTMPDGQVLKGVTAPDGPTFEEWLKSKGSGEDGQ